MNIILDAGTPEEKGKNNVKLMIGNITELAKCTVAASAELDTNKV